MQNFKVRFFLMTGWKDISRQEVITLYDIFVDEGDVEGDLPEEPKASLE